MTVQPAIYNFRVNCDAGCATASIGVTFQSENTAKTESTQTGILKSLVNWKHYHLYCSCSVYDLSFVDVVYLLLCCQMRFTTCLAREFHIISQYEFI